MKLAFPFLDIRGWLLQRAGQPGVVVLQSQQLYLPLLQCNTINQISTKKKIKTEKF